VSEVITIRVSEELKAIMNESKINWSEAIRNYIEMRAKSLRLHKLIKKIEKDANSIKVKGDSSVLVREDRESR
jgi:hypothetical protein